LAIIITIPQSAIAIENQQSQSEVINLNRQSALNRSRTAAIINRQLI